MRTNFVDSGFALINGAPTFLTLRRERSGRPHDVPAGAAGRPGRWRRARCPVAQPAAAEHAFRAARLRRPGRLAHLRRQRRGLPLRGRRASRTSWSTRGRAGGLGRPPLGRGRGEDRPRRRSPSGAALPTSATSSSTCSPRAAAAWSTRTRLRADDQPLARPAPARGTSTGWAWSATSCSTPGTSSGCARSSSARSTTSSEVHTRALWVVEGITSYYGDLLVHRAGLLHRKEYLKEPRARQIETPADDARAAGPAARRVLLRRLDQVLPAGREHAQHRHQLLHQGRRRRLPARRQDPPRDRRPEEPRRRPAPRLPALLRASAASVPRRSARTFEEVAGADLGAWLDRAVETDRGARLRRGPGLVRPALRRETKPRRRTASRGELRAGWLGAGHRGPGRPARGDAGEARDPRLSTPASTSATRSSPSTTTACRPTGWTAASSATARARRASLLVARRDRLIRLAVTFGEKPRPRWKLEALPNATAGAEGALDAWLHGLEAGPGEVGGGGERSVGKKGR